VSLVRRCWIGVASREHVLAGVAGGFCQLGHGRVAPVARLGVGDWLAYYAPRQGTTTGPPVQAFVAIGRIAPGQPFMVELRPGFAVARRPVEWLPAREAPIAPLIDRLSFIADKQHWGITFRRSAFEIDAPDMLIIAEAMGITMTEPATF
jgi:hypothetical protein